MASTVEIVPRSETDLPQLFVFASAVFAALPGWSNERVLEVLRGDMVFVARERGHLAGSVALTREESDAIVIEQLFVAPGHEGRGIGHSLLAYAEGYAIAARAHSLRIVVERMTEQSAKLLQALRLSACGVRTRALRARFST